MADDIQSKMRIRYALREDDARIACSIVEMLRNVADIIDHSSPQVLESICDYINDIQKGVEHRPEHRRVVRDAIYEYVNNALKEQRKIERNLYYGVTGKTEVEEEGHKAAKDDDKPA
jgi:hypothetical protein